ncbi:hypothetical protein ACWKSP_26635 [Micromonosporaceae bacterium Da 78-11]
MASHMASATASVSLVEAARLRDGLTVLLDLAGYEDDAGEAA